MYFIYYKEQNKLKTENKKYSISKSSETKHFLFFNIFKTSLILSHSLVELTSFAPGLVDSPPISIIFAPLDNKLLI